MSASRCLAALVLFLAVPARGQEPAPAGGCCAIWVLGGGGAFGPGLGFGVALGTALPGGLRVDLFAERSDEVAQQAGFDLAVVRDTVELALGYRTGPVEPWIGIGYGRARFDSTTEDELHCELDPLDCSYPNVVHDATEDRGVALAAGLRYSVLPWLLLSVEARKTFMGEASLEVPQGASVDLGAPFFGFGVMLRTVSRSH